MYFSFQIHASQSLILSFISFSLLKSCQRSHCRLTGNITVNVAFCLDPLYVVRSCCSGSKTKCFIFEGVHQSAFGHSLTLQVSLRAPSACLFCLLRAPIAFARLLLHLHHSLASAPLYQDCYCSANHTHSLRPCHSPLRPATLCT